jgi:hypothetical protein
MCALSIPGMLLKTRSPQHCVLGTKSNRGCSLNWRRAGGHVEGVARALSVGDAGGPGPTLHDANTVQGRALSHSGVSRVSEADSDSHDGTDGAYKDCPPGDCSQVETLLRCLLRACMCGMKFVPVQGRKPRILKVCTLENTRDSMPRRGRG